MLGEHPKVKVALLMHGQMFEVVPLLSDVSPDSFVTEADYGRPLSMREVDPKKDFSPPYIGNLKDIDRVQANENLLVVGKIVQVRQSGSVTRLRLVAL